MAGRTRSRLKAKDDMADAVFEPEIKASLLRLQRMGLGPHKIAIECKRTQDARLAFDRVEDVQVRGLLSFEEHGMVRKLIVSQGFKNRRFTGETPFDFLCAGPGHGFLLVNFRFTKQAPNKSLTKGTNRCFAVPIGMFVQAKERAMQESRASLPYAWFVENAIECPRISEIVNGKRKCMWQLEPLLTYMEDSLGGTQQ